jgi:hypothetical protein
MVKISLPRRRSRPTTCDQSDQLSLLRIIKQPCVSHDDDFDLQPATFAMSTVHVIVWLEELHSALISTTKAILFSRYTQSPTMAGVDTNLAATALAIALVALVVALGQLFQQYLGTADGYRRCQISVMGGYAKRTQLH